MSIPGISATLLIANGLINAVPPVSDFLKKISSGKPIIQIVVGLVSVVVGIAVVANVFS